MVATCEAMQEAEGLYFSAGGDAESLMNQAGLACARSIREFFPDPGTATIFCGRGNNGGDALVVAGWLRRWGWRLRLRFSHPREDMSELGRKKAAELQTISTAGDAESELPPHILVDGLLGIGAKGPLRGSVGELAAACNRERLRLGARTFAIDIPSGVDGDSGEVYEGAIVADHTLTICAPKRGLIADRAVNHVGRLHEIPLPELSRDGFDSSLRVIFPSNLRERLPRRPFDTHKGQAGRVTLLAGSSGLTGAPVLTALGALHGGAGLVTLFVPESVYPVVACQTPAEVMVRPYRGVGDLESVESDVLAAGPGMGADVGEDLLELVAGAGTPMVLDADLLNALARSPDFLKRLPPGRRLLTPHPGELVRLAGETEGDRIETTRRLATEWGVTLLHKGARSVIATPDRPVEINSTGHPGMATGGLGDVLTGLCAAWVGQGLPLHDAACAGSWLLGRAAELCGSTVTASEVARHLGLALDGLAFDASMR